jgi:hypothetical protein
MNKRKINLTLNPFPERKGLSEPLPFREGAGGRLQSEISKFYKGKMIQIVSYNTQT